MESRTIKQREAAGWELVGREAGPTMRTDMRFRRAWPNTPGAWVTKRMQTFGRMSPSEKLQAAKVPGAALVVLVVLAVGAGAVFGGGGDDTEPVAAATKTAKPTPKATQVTTKPTPKATEATTKAAPKPKPTPEGPLTVKNNADLKKLLAADEGDPIVAKFAKKYSGKDIEFDGYVADVAPHGDADTRYDFLIFVGDYDPDSAKGPNFQFRDVNNFDLDDGDGQVVLSRGDNVHVVATVFSFDEDNLLFELWPKKTRIR